MKTNNKATKLEDSIVLELEKVGDDYSLIYGGILKSKPKDKPKQPSKTLVNPEVDFSSVKQQQASVYAQSTNIEAGEALIQESQKKVKMDAKIAEKKGKAKKEKEQQDDTTTVASFVPTNQDVYIPSCSAWFETDNYENKIHSIEEESLPEFFSGRYPSKTPTVYKEYRNFMIALYRMNPTVYLSATSCRRHLSGDVNAIIRVHAFLEKWGLINFNCQPRYKPHKMSLLKESSYDIILINAANKNTLQKSEFEYKNNLYLHLDNGQKLKAQADQNLIRKLNILTLSYRPICAFTGCKVGFRWYANDQMTLSSEAYLKGNYPQGQSNFKQQSLPEEVWDKISNDLSEETQLLAGNKESYLSTDDQQTLISLVAAHGVDGWCKAQEALNLKSKKDVILEFMRISSDILPLPLVEDHQMKVEVYNQSDMYLKHCDMLIQFATDNFSVSNSSENKTSKQQRNEIANTLMSKKLQQMNQELEAMQTMQATLEQQKSEDRNIVASLLFERVSLAMAKQTNQ